MASKSGNEVLIAAALGAIKMLQDPKVQDQIASAGSAVADAVKQMNRRRAERNDQPASSTSEGQKDKKERRSPKAVLTSPFGNQKLERRVQNLSDNVGLLRGSVGPEAEAALTEVDSVVDRLQVAVAMAGNLPIGKRQRAHWEIDSVLDKLERAVFASVME